MSGFAWIVIGLGGYAAMRFFYLPRVGEDGLYRWVARPLLLAGIIGLVAGGTPAGAGMNPLMFAFFLYACGAYFNFWPSGGAGGDSHRRGAKIAETEAVAKMARKEGAGGIEWGGIPIPKALENRHFLLCGTTGSGKSVAIKTALDVLRQRHDRVVLADSGGEFCSRYAKAGDVIINPFDSRCANWSPLSEMAGPWDAELIAKSLIPNGDASAAEWNHYGQQFLSALLTRTWESGTGTNAELARLATGAPLDELRDLLHGLPAAALLAKGNEKMFGSIRGIVGSRLGVLTYLPPDAGRDGFSIRKFLAEAGSNWLYLTYRDDQLRSLAPLIGSLLDIAAVGVLSLQPDEQRRIWIVADELDSLGCVDGLLPFLTKSRKYGGCAVLGIQSIAQLRERYGPNGAVTLANCCGTWLALRSPDPETSEFISKFLGDEEVRRVTSGGSDSGDSWSEQITTNRVVLPGQIQNLATNTGFLNLAGPIPTCAVRLELPANRPQAAVPFLARDFSAKPSPSLPEIPEKPKNEASGSGAGGIAADQSLSLAGIESAKEGQSEVTAGFHDIFGDLIDQQTEVLADDLEVADGTEAAADPQR